MNLFLETLATIFGILSVWYARNNKIYVFPTGIVNVLIFAYLTNINKINAETVNKLTPAQLKKKSLLVQRVKLFFQLLYPLYSI